MARKKEFDREQVLSLAMNTFWRYGYEGTSMQTLVASMGINRASLYDTFGDKRSLFLAAIACYERSVMKDMLKSLQAPNAGKQTIIDLFYGLVAKIVSERDYFGCLITNTAVECPEDSETKASIDRNLRQVTNAFKQALIKARVKGEIAGDRDIDSMANYLTSNIQGLRVMSKVNRDPKTLNSVVRIILSTLD